MLKHFIKVATLVGLCYPFLAEAVETYTITTDTISASVSIGGTVVPYKEVTLAAQLPGRVDEIAGEEGDHFEEGNTLVAIDDTELRAKRRAAVAEWMRADATLRNANVQYSRELWSPQSNKGVNGMRLPGLFDEFFSEPVSDALGKTDTGADRRADLHSFGAQIEQSRSALMQAESQIQQIDAKLRDAVGEAPFDGVITKKMVEVGDTVQPGQPLLQFANTKYLQIQIDIPARLVAGLQVGMEVRAKLDVPDNVDNSPRLWPVRVAQIFPIADPQRHTITVKFDLPVDTRIPNYPGQYAEVDIPDISVPQQRVMAIPSSALVQRGSLPGVYVLNPGNNKFELRLVRIGKLVATPKCQNCISVLSGLKEGDVIDVQPMLSIP